MLHIEVHEAEVVRQKPAHALPAPGRLVDWRPVAEPRQPLCPEHAVDDVPVQVRQEVVNDGRQVVEREARLLFRSRQMMAARPGWRASGGGL